MLYKNNNKELFECGFNYLINNLKQKNESVNFGVYLENNYLCRKEMWASCYRIGCGINTNMHLESLHKKLKYSFFHGKQIRRLDKSIHCLLQMLKDYQISRMIKLEKGELSNKWKTTLQRHEKGNCLERIVASLQENDKFLIQNSNENNIEIFCVEYNRVNCCNFLCRKCQICFHTYSCNCPDYMTSRNICKHILYIHLHINKNKEIISTVKQSNHEVIQIHLNSGIEKNVVSQNLNKEKLLNNFKNILNDVETNEEFVIIQNALKNIPIKLKACKLKRTALSNFKDKTYKINLKKQRQK